MRVLTHSALLFCMALGTCSCTWWQAWYVTQEVVEHYPSDNAIEEMIEEELEEHFDAPPGSIDLSPFTSER